MDKKYRVIDEQDSNDVEFMTLDEVKTKIINHLETLLEDDDYTEEEIYDDMYIAKNTNDLSTLNSYLGGFGYYMEDE